MVIIPDISQEAFFLQSGQSRVFGSAPISAKILCGPEIGRSAGIRDEPRSLPIEGAIPIKIKCKCSDYVYKRFNTDDAE